MPSLFFEANTASSSPYINRFLSADTIVPGYANPQNLNRYSYVTNNPLRYRDPTGHMRVQDGPVDDEFSQSVFDEYVPLPSPAETTDEDDEENDPGNILDPTQNDDETLLIPTMDNSLQADDSSNDFWAVVSAFGDIALGGSFASLSVYALVGSCVYAGIACVVTAPIFLLRQ